MRAKLLAGAGAVAITVSWLHFRWEPHVFVHNLTNFTWCPLLGGLFFKTLYIKYAFTIAFELNEEGWRKLTVRWGLFFLGLAILNEAVWRNFSTAVWIYAKIGMIGLTFLFAIAQAPLLMKHQIPHADDGKSAQD